MNNRISLLALLFWMLMLMLAVWISAYTFNGFITYDGYFYYELSTSFAKFNFEHWDFVRTPIFPFLLYLADKFNFSTLPNFIFLNSILTFASFALLIELLFRDRFENKKIFITICIGPFLPTMVIYQHGLLSEATLIFIMSLIFWISATDWSSAVKKYTLLSFVLILAYYIKPHFKYYALVVLLLNCLLFDLKNVSILKFKTIIYSIRWPVIAFLIFLAAIQPWEKVLKQSGRMAALNFFPLMMGVVPVEEKYLGPKHEEYKALLNQNGGVPREGIEHSRIYPFVGGTTEMLLWPAFKYETKKYFIAVLKSISVYIYASPSVSENNNFYNSIKSGDEKIGITKLYHFDGKPDLAHNVYIRYLDKYEKTGWQSIYGIFYNYFKFIEVFLMGFSLVMLAYAVKIKNNIIILGLVLSWSYMLMHALALLAIDRYAAPVKLIILYCFAAFPMGMFMKSLADNFHACRKNYFLKWNKNV